MRTWPFLARLSVICLTVVIPGIAQQTPTPPPQSAPSQTQPSVAAPPPLPFATQIKKAVVFIQTDCRMGEGVESHVGTGFFVFVPEPRIGVDRGFIYLVTNRHVVQPGIENSKPCDVAAYFVRMNLKPQGNNSPASQSVSLGEVKKTGWVFPTDPSVDLAALQVNPDQKVFDFQTVPLGMLSDQKTDGLTEGDSVLFTGLFVQYMGQSRMQPIVRSGTVAMLPDEMISTTLKKQGHVYLTEVHAFGGNSGSPVFVDVGGIRKGKIGFEYKLLGVVSGEVFETADFQLQVATTYKGDLAANSGISIVVPAEDVKALLQSAEFQKKRDDEVAALAKQSAK
jgi:hypothetical protein